MKVTDWLLDQKNKYPEWYNGIEFRVLYQDNAGPAAARNAGLQIATGKYIAFLDADDVFPVGRLSHLVQILEENPSADMVFGLVQPVPDGADILNLELPDGVEPNHIIKHKEFNWGDHAVQGPNRMMGVHSGVYRSQIVSKIGYLDASLRYYEDVDWLVRAELFKCSMLFFLFLKCGHHRWVSTSVSCLSFPRDRRPFFALGHPTRRTSGTALWILCRPALTFILSSRCPTRRVLPRLGVFSRDIYPLFLQPLAKFALRSILLV
jgi:glycosyltransferase involved in cell wall biosynthesis